MKKLLIILIIPITLILVGCNNNNQNHQITLSMSNYENYLIVTKPTFQSAYEQPCFTVNTANNSLVFLNVTITYKIENNIYTLKINIGGYGEALKTRETAIIININGKVLIN